MAHKEKGARLRMRPGKFLALTVVPMALVLVVALLLTAAGTVFAPTGTWLFSAPKKRRDPPVAAVVKHIWEIVPQEAEATAK